MYRVLIVDDEPLIRRGIRRSVDWNELGVEMVAEAANGVEALTQMAADAPDIVLLDISMPHMNGLEFASIVRKQRPDSRVVIITGYPDFEYVRSALRIGVDDYILKPVTKEDIESIVTAQVAALREGSSDPGDLYVETRAVERELNAMLKREPCRAVIPPFLSRRGLRKGAEVSFALMKDYLTGCSMWSSEGDELAEFAVLNVAAEELEKSGAGIAFTTYLNEMALVLTCPEDEVRQVLGDLRLKILDFLQIPVDFGVSERASFGDLAELARQARSALEYSFVLHDADIIFYDKVARQQAHLSPAYPVQEEKDLLDHMLSETPAEIEPRVDRFFARLKEAVPGVRTARMYLLRLVLRLANTAASLASWTEDDTGIPFAWDDVGAQVEQFATLDEAAAWLKQCYADAYEYVRSVHSRSRQLFVTIRTYIEKNYASPSLNLKKCSEDLFLSPSYVSLILKKESGHTFVDYLNEYRIGQAAQLLRATDERVGDVAARVGFTHSTYFSSVFRKIMGMSPKQYRESGET